MSGYPIKGESLRDRLHRGAMRVCDVLDAGADMSRALATAHHAGVIHRDLNPENIFLTRLAKARRRIIAMQIRSIGREVITENVVCLLERAKCSIVE